MSRGSCYLLMMALAGCSMLDQAVGIAPDGSTTGPGVVDILANTGKAFGFWGGIAGGALTTAALWYRHIRILKAGRKDDNFNGIADDEEAKK